MYLKFGTMLDTTKVNSLIPVWMTLMFTQGYRVVGKLELVQSFCCKVAWNNSNVGDGWHWLCEMNVKKSCKYDEYVVF